jgi:erythromycin esterase
MQKPSRAILLLTCVLACTPQVSPARQQTSATVADAEARLLERGKPVEREVKAGETHAYKIPLEAGQFLDAAVNQRGIDLVVRVYAPDGSRVAEIDSPNGKQGDEPVALEVKAAGTYRIEVSPLGQEGNTSPGRYEIRINELLSADAYARRLAERKRQQQAVVAWLRENAIPLKTVEAGSGFGDLQPLKRIFKDVRFVALGEATHGTREFFQFKHRALEFLVKEMGFRVFAIEASYSACENINDYVMGRADDGAKALDSQGFWTWNTEEVRALMDWMREYNKTVPADRRVKFVGFDIQVNDTGKAKLLEYLRRVAPGRAADAEAFFKTSMEDLSAAIFRKGEKAQDELAKMKELRDRYNELFVFLEISGAQLAEKSGQGEYERMREYARVLAQYTDSYTRPDAGGGVARDLYMADNFRRIVGREPAGTRFVLWAHNAHVMTTDHGGSYPTFGYYLRRFYGRDYYALGFSFNQGSFQAMEAQPKDPSRRMLTAFEVTPAPADSVEWYLAQTGTKILIVDYRSRRPTAELGEWLAAPHPLRAVGSMYAPSLEPNTFGHVNLGKDFDGLFFIDTATRARPNPSVKNVARSQ